MGNVSYLSIQGEEISLVSQTLCPLALCNVFAEKTALFAFAVRDAKGNQRKIKIALDKYLPRYLSGPKEGEFFYAPTKL